MVDPTALAGLRRISLADLPAYKAAINQTQRKGWLHFFAFMLLVSQGGVHKSSSETYWLGDDEGSLCVYILREGKSGIQLNLFLAPMPLQVAVLQRCVERVGQYNQGGRTSIFRMDADEAESLRTLPGVRISVRPEEYLYAPGRYQKLSGDAFADLRHAVNQVRRLGDVQVLPYTHADATDCRAVHQQWIDAQGGKYPAINNLTFTRNCLAMADSFPSAELSGVVVRINGEAKAFGFFGEMRADLGNLFISYSDHRIGGLHRFLTLQMLGGLQHLALVNSGDDAGAPSLAAAKRALRPVGMQAMCQVYFS